MRCFAVNHGGFEPRAEPQRRLKDAFAHANLEKYNTRSSLKYVQDLGRTKSRVTTTELVSF